MPLSRLSPLGDAPEPLLKGQPLAAFVSDLPAADKAFAGEDMEHPAVVEIRVDAEGSDSLFTGQPLRLLQKGPPETLSQCLVGYGQPMDDHIRSRSEPLSVEGIVGRLAVENDRSVSDDRFGIVSACDGCPLSARPGVRVAAEDMPVAATEVGDDVSQCGVAVLSLPAARRSHAALGLGDDLQDARHVVGRRRSESVVFHRLLCESSVCPPPLNGLRTAAKIGKDLYLSSWQDILAAFCHELSLIMSICDNFSDFGLWHRI